MNLVDLFIIVFLGYFLVLGYFRGFIREVLDIIVLIFAFFVSFKSYLWLGGLIASKFNFPISYGNVFAFFLVWFLIEITYYIIFIIFYDKIPEEVRESKVNKFFGLVPSIIRWMIYTWVILGLVVVLPLSTNWRNNISHSFFGQFFVRTTTYVEKYVGNIFNGAISDTIDFLTINPQSNEKVDLGFKTDDISVDEKAENKMLELVNNERTQKGLEPLVMDESLRKIAREHSKDMFNRGYFAHNTPEGKTPFDRMDVASISYMIAGENLALAPDVQIAHTGLMNSPGHKANIMTNEYRKVGVGVYKSNVYGEIFSQEFTN